MSESDDKPLPPDASEPPEDRAPGEETPDAEALADPVDPDALTTLVDSLVFGSGSRADSGAISPLSVADGTTLADEIEAHVGEHIGPYVLEEALGVGGQGVVYRARDTRFQRQVALKLLIFRRGSGTALERFKREAAIASRLDHSGICTVYDAGTLEGVLFIAMRYVEGETLARFISTNLDPTTGSISWSSDREELHRILRVVEQSAIALHGAHEAGIIHRDVKPQNIMITPEGDPVILDFGLARDQRGDDPTLTSPGDVFGTPVYMAPEQILGDPSRIDRRTDVYGLGVTLFECLTGHRPFDAPNTPELNQRILKGAPRDPRSFNPQIGSDLRVILEKCLEKDPQRRYASALELAEDLRRVRNYEPILARRASLPLRCARWFQRNAVLGGVLSATFLMLVLGLGVTLSILQEVRHEKQAKVEALSTSEERGQRLAEVLRGFTRLSDQKRLEDLALWDSELWPPSADRVRGARGMDAWLEQAEALRRSGQEHRRDLEALRARALPYEDADRERDRRFFATHYPEETARLEITRELLEWFRTHEHPRKKDALPALEANVARLEKLYGRRESWRFEDEASAWRQEVLQRLIEELDALPPRIDAMKARRALALRAEQTWQEHRTRWSAVVERLAADSRFPKLRLAPQEGLVPLGPDPASGLEEFVHLYSGGVPERGADGRLELRAEHGAILVLLPGGRFAMGSQRDASGGAGSASNLDPDAIGDEAPVHFVELAPFFMGKHELTQAQWEALGGGRPSLQASKETDPKHYGMLPVERISWTTANTLLARHDLVLPTEARWEYACRAGTSTPWWSGTTVASLSGVANLGDEASKDRFPEGWEWEPGFRDPFVGAAPIGRGRANAFGLHDVHGNVWEWCLDPYSSYEAPLRGGDAHRLGLNLRFHTVRGGSYRNLAIHARSSFRYSISPATSNENFGVRAARPVRDR